MTSNPRVLRLREYNMKSLKPMEKMIEITRVKRIKLMRKVEEIIGKISQSS